MGWLSGWQYRKKVTISGSSGAGTNYQVKLSIGSSSGGDFHLEGHCTDFPNDIRFTDDDGETLLDYWIEDPTQDPITVWVEVQDSLDSDVDIYVYYGNPSASSAIDGEATFEFFDDFEIGKISWSLGTEGFKKPFSHFAVNIQQTGLLPSDYVGDITNPTVAWSYDAGEVGLCVLVDDVNNDGKGEVVFATDSAIRCLDWQGNLLWTYSIPDTGIHTFLIIDDINNDGTKEVVFGTYVTHEVDGYVRCLNASSGEEIWNYYCNKGVTTTGSDPNGIQVADIDGDGEKEVIVLLDIDGELLVLNADGTLKYSKTDASEFEYGVAVGDIDNDGELEYVHGTESNGIHIRKASDGTLEASWSGATNTYFSASPTIGDIDGDGKMEILAGLDVLASGGTSLVCLEDDGTVKWAVTDKGDMDYASGLLADIDGDGNYEFVRGSDDYNIYCFNALTGEIKWTYSTNDNCKYAPVLGVDIDGDGNLEIIVLNQVDGYIYCLDNAGNLKWKISVGAGGQYCSLAIADLNNDGKVELIVPTTNGVACYVNGEGNPLEKWTIVSGTWSADNGYLERTGTSSNFDEIYAEVSNPITNFAIDLRMLQGAILDEFDIWIAYNADETVIYVVWNENGGQHVLSDATDGALDSKTNVDEANTWWDISFRKYGNNFKVYKDGVLWLSGSPTTDRSAETITQVRIMSRNTVAGEPTNKIDLIRVRKYTEPEPSFSSAGSEESPYFTCIDISSLTSSPLPFQELHTLCSEVLKTSGASSSLLSAILNSQDNFGLLDANLSGLLLIASSIDTIDTSDGCTITFSFTGNCLDILHSTDNASSLLSMLCQSTDKFGGTDSELSQLSLLTTLLDKLHQHDSSASNITLERTILDILGFQDLSSFPIGIIVSASDILHIYDLNSVRLTFSCSSIDIIKNADSSGVNVTFHLSTDDILKGTDFVSGHLQAILSALDALKISDSSLSSMFAGILVSASDILATSDYNAIRLEFLESSIDIIKSKDSSSSIVSFQLNSTDVLHGIDILTANLQAILGAISKFKNSDETSSYEVIIGIPVKIFKAQEKVLVFRAKKSHLGSK